MLFDQCSSYKMQQKQNEDIPKLNEYRLEWYLIARTKDAATAPMTGLRSVMFFDNDTLLWSNASSYSPVSSQFVIAIYNEGFILIDYIAQTATEVRNTMQYL